MAAAFRDQAAARGKTSELDRRAGIEHPPELLEQVGLRLLPPISTRRRIGKVVALEIERQAIERAALGESVGKLRVHNGFGGVARHRSEARRVGKAGVSTCRSRG